jgi:PPM family protein phosphatase
MSIGEFGSRSRLSAKALRLYDELSLLPPARVDEDSGYHFYEPGQLKQARLIAALRQLQVPLAEIKAILALEPAQAADRVREFGPRPRNQVCGERAAGRVLGSWLVRASGVDGGARTTSPRTALLGGSDRLGVADRGPDPGGERVAGVLVEPARL